MNRYRLFYSSHQLFFFIILMTALLSLQFLSFVYPSQAQADNSLSLTPSTQTLQTGSQFTLTVAENSDDPVNVVEFTLTYPSDKITFISNTPDTSSFPMEIASDISSGTIHLIRGIPSTSISGPHTVTTVTFQVNSTATGELNFQVSNASLIRPSDTSNVLGVVPSLTLSVAQPPSSTPTPLPQSVTPSPTDSAGSTPIPSLASVQTYKKGDLNHDTRVDIYDLSFLFENWSKHTASADPSGDGIADLADLSIILSQWGN